MPVQYLKAYLKEDTLHKDLKSARISRQEAASLLELICKSRGRRSPELDFDLVPYSYYQGDTQKRPEHINIASDMLNVLTVIHEASHFIHGCEYRERLSAAILRGDESPTPVERPHGPAFQAIVNSLADLVRKTGWERPPEIQAVDTVAAFFRGLPEMAQCPRCQQVKGKAEFGVRVMSRDPAGLPVKVARQSYCRSCR